MDDTNYLDSSGDKIQASINITTQFYHYHDVNINGKINRTTFNKRQCSSEDTKERSYRIKNLLKDLPTYETLYKREIDAIENSMCIRCGKNEEETWDHVWICNDNEANLDEIVRESISKFEEYLNKNGRSEDVTILRDHNINIVTILEERSNILLGKSRIWEMLRGVFNDRFNHLTKVKEEKAIIKECWNFIYNEFKNRIWLIRCEEVARLEKLIGIQKQDLRKKRRKEQDKRKEDFKDENIENKKTNKIDKKKQKKEFDKKINIVTRDRLIGSVTDRNNIENIWDLMPKIY
ncbi:hypothetical protein RhiirA4_487262 [Rhizophagus irregularis]|uniref:Uncharacterized protein n=1 Tax=Rhizophagus irregularis TaxID=588596 RepID=A0A2I1HSC3_9GLOM|nr:hypothetical protein RhiirA4_487262 [Rhizophagus irregularis]